MKKSISIILVLLFAFSMSISGNENLTYGLTSEQVRKFNYQRLTYNTQSGAIGSITDYGTYTSSNYEYWVPYRGTEKISEPLFFEIAGNCRV